MRYLSQILASTVAGTALIGGSSAPASAFSSQFQQYATVTAQPDHSGSSLRAGRANVARTPATASRSQPPAKSEPTPSNPATKAAGPLQIIVSLDRQQLTLYSDGQPIARSRVSTGMRGHQTPAGVFSIIQKSRWHRSNIYEAAPMFFMQRITWSGIALHQGVVPNHPASHGCIRMPEALARQLWTTTRMGVRVIVAHGDVAPVAISHPNLFTPKHAPAVSQAQALEAGAETWTFARLASQQPLVGATATDFPMVTVPESTTPVVPPRTLKDGPVSVFVSRKEGRLYVRKGFEPLFDVPVTIAQAAQPIGTHVFTAMAQNDAADTMRWTVVSVAPAAAGSPTSAAAALDRVVIPQDVRDQISELLTPGSSLIISDQGLGPETGKGTDFIVLTR